MSDDCPNPCTPAFSASCRGAAESVCWAMMSAPCAISALVASASLPGSNQEFTHTILTFKEGSIDCAPSIKASMPAITSGIGKGAT